MQPQIRQTRVTAPFILSLDAVDRTPYLLHKNMKSDDTPGKHIRVLRITFLLDEILRYYCCCIVIFLVIVIIVHCAETCRAGHYFSRDRSQCVECSRGSYQAQTGQDFCVRCPAGTTTDHQAAVSAIQCKSKLHI